MTAGAKCASFPSNDFTICLSTFPSFHPSLLSSSLNGALNFHSDRITTPQNTPKKKNSQPFDYWLFFHFQLKSKCSLQPTDHLKQNGNVYGLHTQWFIANAVAFITSCCRLSVMPRSHNCHIVVSVAAAAVKTFAHVYWQIAAYRFAHCIYVYIMIATC